MYIETAMLLKSLCNKKLSRLTFVGSLILRISLLSHSKNVGHKNLFANSVTGRSL